MFAVSFIWRYEPPQKKKKKYPQKTNKHPISVSLEHSVHSFFPREVTVIFELSAKST